MAKDNEAEKAAESAAKQAAMRERALFYLDRKIKDLSSKVMSHEEMADNSMSYAERRRYLANTDAQATENSNELEAWMFIKKQLTKDSE